MPFYGNTIYPATYQPQYSAQYVPQYQQPQYQPVMQAQQQTQPVQQQSQPFYNASRIWVNGRSEADFYPIAPNSAVDLWDRDGKTLYQKRADATGKPSIAVCDVTERAMGTSDAPDEKDGQTVSYASKDDLSAVVAAVKDLSSVVSTIKSEVDGIKGDVYGIAGKRKSTKKAEVADDDD